MYNGCGSRYHIGREPQPDGIMADTLIVQLARLGDLLQTRRLIASALADGDTVHLALDASLADLAGRLFPQTVIHPLSAHAGNKDIATVFASNHTAVTRLQGMDFRRVFTCNHSGMAFALTALFPAEIVRGYKTCNGQRLRSNWNRRIIRLTGDRRASPINLVDIWAWQHPQPVDPVSVNPPAAEKAGPIGVVLAGREARRSLSPDSLADLVTALFISRGGPAIRLFGTTAERPRASQLVRRLSPAATRRVENLCGKTGLTDCVDAVGECSLVISPDTGLMHLAAFLGVPVIATFLSSAWCHETGPYGAGHTVLQAVPPCAPCMESTPCPRKVICAHPFADSSLAGYLAGKQGTALPPGIIRYQTGFDAFGLLFSSDEEDPGLCERRGALRSEAALGLGIDLERKGSGTNLSQEREWMLPPMY